MLKQNKTKLLITSIVILIPVVIGLLLWNQLPDKIVTHWNAEGVADGWSSKAFAVFAMPCFLLALHWLCLLITNTDPKRKNYSERMFTMVVWICPITSVLMTSLVYGIALGMEISIEKVMPIFLGLMFIIIGNYLPKCKQNYTLGIKIPWTLNDEENWNYTHRLTGKIWVVVGFVLMMCAMLPSKVIFLVFIVVLIVATVIPVICSYSFYKKKEKN